MEKWRRPDPNFWSSCRRMRVATNHPCHVEEWVLATARHGEGEKIEAKRFIVNNLVSFGMYVHYISNLVSFGMYLHYISKRAALMLECLH